MQRRSNERVRFGERFRKGARLQRPFCVYGWVFVFAFWPVLGYAAPVGCAADTFDERATVRTVYDGDTFALTDGRHVRFIGVNTPEVAHEKRPAEPYSEAARAAVEKMLQKDRTVLLRYGEERFDVHRRTLAHVYLSDRSSVEAQLVAEGLAFAISIPPNLHDSVCYRAQEKTARAAKRGIWSHDYFKPLDAQQVSGETLGFRLVKGRVQRVGQSKKSVWLNLSANMALRIAREDLQYFTGFNPETLRGKTVIARGWIAQFKNGEFVMRLRHPDGLELQD